MTSHPIFGKYNSSLVKQATQSYIEIKPNIVLDMICPDCNHDYETCISHNIKTRKDIPNSAITYQLNNYGFRSDDFSIENSKDGFLFSGCSYTYGIGIPYSLTWAYQFNSRHNTKFQNLSIGANNIQITISNIFEYIKIFGKPKGIFLLLPPYVRNTTFSHNYNYSIEEEPGVYINTLSESITDININRLNMYTQITALETYCKEANIPLIWGCWEMNTAKDIRETCQDLFSNYIDVSLDTLNLEEMAKAPKELKDNQYWFKSRDPFHFGGNIHYIIANRFMDEWNRKYA